MKIDLKFDFVADRSNHTITVTREFAGRRRLVWDCHTKSELLDRWFAPEPLTTRTKHMDFREGGHWHYAMIDPEGQEYWSRIDYLTIDPIDHYSALDGFSDASGAVNPEMPRSNWDVTFTDLAERTLVRTIVTYGSAEDIDKVIAMGLKDGLASTLQRLDKLLLELEK
jgi:uncharacterized protein YndB with AHSA1/START domain